MCAVYLMSKTFGDLVCEGKRSEKQKRVNVPKGTKQDNVNENHLLKEDKVYFGRNSIMPQWRSAVRLEPSGSASHNDNSKSGWNGLIYVYQL